MGYSLATPIRSDKQRDLMYDFLRRHYTEPHILFGGEYSFSHLVRDGELAYDGGKCRIGFNYNTSGLEFDYILTICRWMALVVGRRSSRLEHLTGQAIPYVVYDGSEAWPVILKNTINVNENLEWCLVDKYGLRSGKVRLARRLFNFLFLRRYLSLIRKELKNLSELWVAEGGEDVPNI